MSDDGFVRSVQEDIHKFLDRGPPSKENPDVLVFPALHSRYRYMIHDVIVKHYPFLETKSFGTAEERRLFVYHRGTSPVFRHDDPNIDYGCGDGPAISQSRQPDMVPPCLNAYQSDGSGYQPRKPARPSVQPYVPPAQRHAHPDVTNGINGTARSQSRSDYSSSSSTTKSGGSATATSSSSSRFSNGRAGTIPKPSSSAVKDGIVPREPQRPTGSNHVSNTSTKEGQQNGKVVPSSTPKPGERFQKPVLLQQNNAVTSSKGLAPHVSPVSYFKPRSSGSSSTSQAGSRPVSVQETGQKTPAAVQSPRKAIASLDTKKEAIVKEESPVKKNDNVVVDEVPSPKKNDVVVVNKEPDLMIFDDDDDINVSDVERSPQVPVTVSDTPQPDLLSEPEPEPVYQGFPLVMSRVTKSSTSSPDWKRETPSLADPYTETDFKKEQKEQQELKSLQDKLDQNATNSSGVQLMKRSPGTKNIRSYKSAMPAPIPESQNFSETVFRELSEAFGDVNVSHTSGAYQSYGPNCDLDNYGHVVEIYDIPVEFKTEHVVKEIQIITEAFFDIKWVDDTHALAVFSSADVAKSAVNMKNTGAQVKLRLMVDATEQSREKARAYIRNDVLSPFKERPETNAAAARRMVAGALGVTIQVPKAKREEEIRQLREAKDKKVKTVQQKQDVWEGNV